MSINNIIYDLETLAMIFGVLIAVGFVAYKMKFADSWEGGVKLILKTFWYGFKKIGKFLYEEFSGKAAQEEEINEKIYLTNQEMMNFVDEFDGRPYNTPILAGSEIRNGIWWADISAASLSPTYRDTSMDTIKDLCQKVIQRFFMKVRETSVKVYIRVVTPTRLYFAIPLSEKGRKFLEDQIASENAQNNELWEEYLSESRLEEEISERNDYESRL